MLERLLTAFERIDGSTSIDEALGAAADGFADDFSRIVVVKPDGSHLALSQQRGSVLVSGFADAASELSAESPLAVAARTLHVQVSATPATSGGDTPFGGQPTLIVAAPIPVRGELVALLYADDEGRSGVGLASESAGRMAGVIQRHTALRVEQLTIEVKAMAELRAYAQMLLDEVEFVHAADAASQRAPQEQRARLSENLRCARQIFQQRITLEGPAAATLLDEIIAKVIDTKSGTSFGVHLADATMEVVRV